MERRPIEIQVAGQSVRVVSSEDAEALHRLAGEVDARVRVVGKGKPPAPRDLVLAALALAHDLERERTAREHLENQARAFAAEMLIKIDAALGDEPAPEQ